MVALNVPGNLKPLGFVQMTSITTARGLASIPAGARVALLQCETAGVRLRDDGVAPDGSVGLLYPHALSPTLYQGDLWAVQVIEDASSAVLNIAYYGTPEKQS